MTINSARQGHVLWLDRDAGETRPVTSRMAAAAAAGDG
jgi:hypothetical protein